jgi:hypothetical protein
MTVTAKCLLEAKQAENAQTTQYTTPAGTRTIVDKFSARSVAGATFSVNIVASGGAAGASNLVVTKTLAAGEQYTFPELVGQVLNAGDVISTISSVATDTVIRISGRENT